MKAFFSEHKRVLWILYLPFYLIWWKYLEIHVVDYHIIECALDKYIPFCEYFIIPYELWFIMVPCVWFYFCFKDKQEFYQFILFLYGGMTVFLIVSSIYPNGLDLRVDYDSSKNFFTRLTYALQNTDTPTNVFPSIHVYNSVGVQIAIMKSKHSKNHPILKIVFLLLNISICLSTLFLRQHSVVDLTGGLLMAFPFYWIAYVYYPKHRPIQNVTPVIAK